MARTPEHPFREEFARKAGPLRERKEAAGESYTAEALAIELATDAYAEMMAEPARLRLLLQEVAMGGVNLFFTREKRTASAWMDDPQGTFEFITRGTTVTRNGRSARVATDDLLDAEIMQIIADKKALGEQALAEAREWENFLAQRKQATE